MENHYFFFLQDFVNNSFKTPPINHDNISIAFQKTLKKDFTDNQLADLLIYAGYIPDIYQNDSSEETLFTKLVEVLVCEWACRMGFTSQYIKQKASYEDVNITINEKIIVCDAKSFRLGRSQKAPNVKDFLKLEDIRKWLTRHPKKLGGLVTYPCTHEWINKSDAYQYCSDKSAPTVMLPYKYLSFLLKYKNNYNTNDLEQLWNYNRIFPTILEKNMVGGNRNIYWLKIDTEIIRITKTSPKILDEYKAHSDSLINTCIKQNLLALQGKRYDIITEIQMSVDKETNLNTLKKDVITYRISTETRNLDELINRINKFRL